MNLDVTQQRKHRREYRSPVMTHALHVSQSVQLTQRLEAMQSQCVQATHICPRISAHNLANSMTAAADALQQRLLLRALMDLEAHPEACLRNPLIELKAESQGNTCCCGC